MVGMSKVSFSEELISLHIEKTFNFTIYIFTFFSVNVLEQFSNTLTVRSSKVVVNLFSAIVMTPRQIYAIVMPPRQICNCNASKTDMQL